MKKMTRIVCTALMAANLVLVTLSGCSTRSASLSGDPAALPPVTSFAGDLQDIEMPPELEWERDKSMTIKTESFNGGIWRYEGRVEPLSLKDYMISSMHGNKWKLVGESASQDIMLAFVKPNKTCMMVLSDGTLGKTRLTLYVTIDRTAAAGLNPFGEPVNQ